jgi:L-alanine-DL-glutamate epimerase-like enolase superfamily enzyme
VEVASHGGGPTNVHMLCAMPNAIYVETSGISGQDRYKEKLRMENGDILAPVTPGMGSELDIEYVEENRVKTNE